MERPISVHTTPFMFRFQHLTILGLLIFAGATLYWLDLVAGVIYSTVIVIAVAATKVNLFKMYPYRLEIHDGGIVYRAIGDTRTLKWSDIEAVSRFDRSSLENVHDNYLLLVHSNGNRLKLRPMSNWTKARRFILAHVAPLILRNIIDANEGGEDIQINRLLHFNRGGLTYKGRFIDWANIQNVFSTGKYFVIESPHIQIWRKRAVFNTDLTPNGMFHAELIHHLWKGLPLDSPLAEPTYIVIDGIHFNSEGEIIQFVSGDN